MLRQQFLRRGRVSRPAVALVLVFVLLVSLSSSAIISFAAARSLLRPLSVRVQHLSVERHPDLVIASHTPHWSWQPGSASDASDPDTAARGAVQSAYELRLATVEALRRPEVSRLAWDSGKVLSNQSRHVQYSGPALASDTSYAWSLRFWDGDGSASDWAAGRLRTGLFSPAEEFAGQWIGHELLNMNELRREFSVPAQLSRASVFVAVAGYYELFVNGSQVDPTRRLDPGWTSWEQDVLYTSFDLTPLLSAAGGPAAIGVRLGDGWYSQQQNAPDMGYTHPSYGPARLLLQLNMQTSAGQLLSLVSDVSWTGREGAVTSSSPYMGEAFSAMRERDGWSCPGFTDPLSLWTNATVLPSPLLQPNSTQSGLRLQTMEPIRAGDAALHIATRGTPGTASGSAAAPEHHRLHGADLLQGGVLHPVSVQNDNVGIIIYDMGQTFSGTCTLTFSGLSPRILVSVQHAEVMRLPNQLGVDSNAPDYSYIRGAASTDTYIAKGVNGEKFTPKFTVHGFRYVAVYGVDDGGQISDVTCEFIHSACALIGNFSTSSAILNQVQHNVQWSLLSNLMSVATDCPSRDERRGYGGDGALGVDAALYNFDLAAFYDSWLYQWRVAQRPGGMVPLIAPGRTDDQTDPNWSTVLATVAWALYEHYGDASMVQRHYPVVHDWVDFSWAQYNQTGLKGFFGFVGDWVPPPPFGQSNMQLISAFSFLRDLHTLARMAQLLNYTADYSTYSALYTSLAAEWHRTWYNDGIKGYADGMQAANVMSLFLPHVVPDAVRADVLNSLVKDVRQRGQFTTGMVSFARLFPVLSESGQHDLALELVQQTSYPSFGYEFNNPWENATTLWEVWNAPLQGVIMDSRNHAMFGSISAWFYRYVAGISVNAFSPILIQPRMAANHSLLQRVTAEVQSVAGAITVDYLRSSASHVSLTVSVPVNTEAQLTMEALLSGGRCASLSESGRPVLQRSATGAMTVYAVEGVSAVHERPSAPHHVELRLGSGVYRFEATWAVLDRSSAAS